MHLSAQHPDDDRLGGPMNARPHRFEMARPALLSLSLLIISAVAAPDHKVDDDILLSCREEVG